MDNRKSDTFIVPKKLLITVEGRGVHFIAQVKLNHADKGELISW